MKRRRQDEAWFWQIGTELQRLSDQMLEMVGAATAINQRSWRPKIDLCESEDAIEITVEIAGVEPRAIAVQYAAERHAIVIRGKREPEDSKCSLRCYQLEVLYGEFERVVNLPDVVVDKNRIRARYSNGMLYISVPKRREAPQRRKVPITQE